MGVHDGHRERIKAAFAENGLDSFNDVKVLELLLFYSISRRDTNDVAHALIDRFGSLAAVMEATLPELIQVPGVGENSAILIQLAFQMQKKYNISKASRPKSITSSREAAYYVYPLLSNERVEVALILCLDPRNRVMSCKEMGRGVMNSVSLSIRKVVDTAVKHNACSVILAHNHPNGICFPSVEDRAITENLKKALQLLDIPLLDHIIIADEKAVSVLSGEVLKF